ncbi:S66 peptidase family protein [Leeuwenhoekiella sp. W20_SRS_FM14]|uniref:S66 peptidase family protein n=1 Tax=Leeuwenhoekiella sp. W20_SRS_FM14 TaxID=3240270 RepID=UPI003F958078
MLTPPYLKKGDKVGIVCTARKVDEEDLHKGILLLESYGLIPVLGKTIGAEDDQFGGTDAARTADLQTMLDDEEIKAVWCARGGYGTVRIIDQINFYKFVKYPKWVVGYSDITVLHSQLHMMGFETIHGVMPVGIARNTVAAKQTLEKAWFGKALNYSVKPAPLNRLGTGTGELVGGNISILYSLCGSNSSIHTKNKILFIEDLDEYLYHVDRMMVNLKRNNMLCDLKGLVVGSLTKMHDNSIPFGKTAKEIVLDAVKDYDFPVCFNFPAGHLKDNCALILGRNVSLEVTEKGSRLAFDHVE